MYAADASTGETFATSGGADQGRMAAQTVDPRVRQPALGRRYQPPGRLRPVVAHKDADGPIGPGLPRQVERLSGNSPGGGQIEERRQERAQGKRRSARPPAAPQAVRSARAATILGLGGGERRSSWWSPGRRPRRIAPCLSSVVCPSGRIRVARPRPARGPRNRREASAGPGGGPSTPASRDASERPGTGAWRRRCR